MPRALAYARVPVQTKLRVGAANDPLEHEADRVADAVMRGEPAGPVGRAPAATQRKCAGCKAEDQDEVPVQRKCASCAGNEGAHASGDAASRAVEAGGAPLSSELRAYFEPRFGRDLSGIRLHADGRAGRAAEAIDARAFAVGSHIGFAPGEYAPHRTEGRRLIAHELAHTIQQAPFVARQFHRRRFGERGGGGTTDFEESVQVEPAPRGSAIVGSVDRREIAPASDTEPEQVIHTGVVRDIAFQACALTVPHRITFRQRPTAAAEWCDDPPPATAVTPLTGPEMSEISSSYVRALNEGLNGWYSVRVSGCDEEPCANQRIPIRIQVTEETTSADTIIDVVNRGGRGNAGTICARDYDAGFAVHEGGHQVLGLGDEYPERNRRILARVPEWGRRERVRTDLTQMGSHSAYGRFAQYHERHFRFAQVFLEAVYRGRGCTVELVRERETPIEMRVRAGIGAAFVGETMMSVTGMLGIGVPLERQRQVILEFGLQGQMFAGSWRERNAYMLGILLGLEARTPPGELGVGGRIFGSAGALHRPRGPEAETGTTMPERTSAYGEAGLGLTLDLPPGLGVDFQVGGEAAIGREILDDPTALEWLRAGVVLGGSF
jgi:hypothetical protein